MKNEINMFENLIFQKYSPQVTSWVVHLAPIGVCFLIAGEILHMKSVLAELTKLAW